MCDDDKDDDDIGLAARYLPCYGRSRLPFGAVLALARWEANGGGAQLQLGGHTMLLN